jgi:hypothetical protein
LKLKYDELLSNVAVGGRRRRGLRVPVYRPPLLRLLRRVPPLLRRRIPPLLRRVPPLLRRIPPLLRRRVPPLLRRRIPPRRIPPLRRVPPLLRRRKAGHLQLPGRLAEGPSRKCSKERQAGGI